MKKETVIPHSNSPGPPEFTLKVNGITLPMRLSVYGISISKKVNQISRAKIIFLDGDPAKQDFELSNQEWFTPGNEIEILVGPLNEESLMFKGIIIKQQIAIRRSTSLLEIDCRDAAYKMTLRRKSRYFENISDRELAEQLIREYKLKDEVADTAFKHTEIVQYDCTDWDFLLTRMDANGLITLVEDGNIRISPPDFDQDKIFRLEYGSNVLEFDGELEARNQFQNITSSTWNYSDQSVLEIQAKAPAIEANGNLPGDVLATANGKDPILYRHGGNIKETELQAWANARLLKDRLSRATGRVQIQGFNGIQPGQIAMLSGFGERFNGPVYISAVHQELFEEAWITDIEFGLCPKWFAQKFTMEAPRAAGMLPAVHGLQIGLVTQIENDPEGQFRLQVRLPIIDPKSPGIWARLATLDAGTNRGTFFLPEIDDEVIVGFINDDPREALVLGMLHSRNKPAPFEAGADNLEKGYISREGMKIVFHEGKKSITLETPEGNQLLISDDKKGFVFTDQHGNSIEMNANGISLNSEKDVVINAKQNLKTSAGSSWQAQSKGQVQLKAASLNEIKGMPVNIN